MKVNLKIDRILLLVIFFSFTHISFAQTTIGSDLEPISGTLLDLKEYAPDSNNSTAIKGLILPRVKLTDKNQLYPMFSNNITYTGQEKVTQDIQHIGLVVYNTNSGEPYNFCQGVYVWNGDQWSALSDGDLDTFTDPRDSVVYPIQTFGSAGTWMLINLRATKMPDGSSIDRGVSSNLTDKRYDYPNLDVSILDEHKSYGLLYSWAAATNGYTATTDHSNDSNQEQIQGICPDGWHLPSDYEWNILEKEIATHPTLYSTNTVVDWDDSYFTEVSARGSYGTSLLSTELVNGIDSNGKSKTACEKGGFNVLSVGFMAGGGYQTYGQLANFWTSSAYVSQSNNTSSWVRAFGTFLGSQVLRNFGARNILFSVRCIRN